MKSGDAACLQRPFRRLRKKKAALSTSIFVHPLSLIGKAKNQSNNEVWADLGTFVPLRIHLPRGPAHRHFIMTPMKWSRQTEDPARKEWEE